MEKDPYKILGLQSGASADEIKAAFLREADLCQKGVGTYLSAQRYEDIKRAAAAVALRYKNKTPPPAPSYQTNSNPYSVMSHSGHKPITGKSLVITVIIIILAIIEVYILVDHDWMAHKAKKREEAKTVWHQIDDTGGDQISGEDIK